MSSTVRRRRVSRAPVPRRHRRWPAVVAVAGVVAVTAAAVYAASPRGGGKRPDAQAWDRKAQTAFAELVDRTPKLVSDARDWLAGASVPAAGLLLAALLETLAAP